VIAVAIPSHWCLNTMLSLYASEIESKYPVMQNKKEKKEPTASAGATAVDTGANFCFLETKNKKAANNKIPIGK